MDALALNVLHWIFSFNSGSRVALYCSDVAGAFDRVSGPRLIDKLAAKGLHPNLLKLLESWLDERSYSVIVDGTSSAPNPLRNSVYQGTVWGPPLWNCYYEDARHAVNENCFTETVFADDLNCFKSFDGDALDSDIQVEMRQCQDALHSWGSANQVVFDPAKESFHILHP